MFRVTQVAKPDLNSGLSVSTTSEQSTGPNGLPEREQTQKDQMQLRGMCEGVHCNCPGTAGGSPGWFWGGGGGRAVFGEVSGEEGGTERRIVLPALNEPEQAEAGCADSLSSRCSSYQLCDLWRACQPLCASIAPSVIWGIYYYFPHR